MKTKHNFVQLAEVQKAQGTLYCGGLDVHLFGSPEKNAEVYKSVLTNPKYLDLYERLCRMYLEILKLILPVGCEKLAESMAAIECYLMKVVNILVDDCNVRVFKPQSAFYEQFGPIGFLLLSRITSYIRHFEDRRGIRLIVLLDCKRGDIDTTQAAYLNTFFGGLQKEFDVNYLPFNFDIINVTPWMGEDVLVMGTEEKPGAGLQFMRDGKGIIVVNKTSNPTGPQYQEMNLAIPGEDTLQMKNVKDLYRLNYKFDLEYDGLSPIGLVVGSTHPCDGYIRQSFPSTTLLVPGFGAQGGKFGLIMPELIREGKWNGLGAIFSSSRGTMYPFLEKLGGSGKVENLREDLIKAVALFRENERKAFEDPAVRELGIYYPFDKAA